MDTEIFNIYLSNYGFPENKHTLYINYPINGTYSRSYFHPIKFIKNTNLISAYCDVLIDHPGAYQYYVNYKHRTFNATGYFIIEPRIILPATNTVLPLKGLRLLSMVPKWMGNLAQWSGFLEQADYSNYNIIHFAPMQKRGISGSPFSIDNPLFFSDDLFCDNDNKKSNEEKMKLVKSTIDIISSKHGILSLSDVVWNHVSNSSELLYEHPEIGYNLHNSPHLMAAYELDSALINLSSCMEELDLPFDIASEQDIDEIISYIENSIFPALKLFEYKWIRIDEQIQTLHKYLHQNKSVQTSFSVQEMDMMQLLNEKIVVNGHVGTRFHKSLDCEYTISLLLALNSTDQMTEEWIDKMCSRLHILLEEYNSFHYNIYEQDVKIALKNIKNRLMYTQLANDGPKLGIINEKNPIVESYFVHLKPKADMDPNMILLCNGWLWDLDPLSDFAGPGSSAYIRREVIVWSDCVKLRYGDSPKDSPWLWKQMRDYTENTARIFHGIRIDNCHSTPLQVAEYLLDAARKIRPNLYVLAELFTGSTELDRLFVSRLGIHALIREAMHSPNSHELSKLVELYHDLPGSVESSPPALFMDCTHDNETPFQKRTAQDTLPNAAIVAFSGCAIGSVKGYDEIYPRRLDIVSETRLYGAIAEYSVGIIKAKSQLLDIHGKMLLDGYSEVKITQEHDFVIIHRMHPKSEDGYLLIARTAFEDGKREPAMLRLERTRVKLEFGYSLKVDAKYLPSMVSSCIQGLPSHLEPLEAPLIIRDRDSDSVQIHFSDRFSPGSIYVLNTAIHSWSMQDFEFVSTLPDDTIKDLELLDCNVILYRCQVEENDSTGHGPLAYAGLQGFMSVFPRHGERPKEKNPLFKHLEQGYWAFEYIFQRLERYKNNKHLIHLIRWFKSRVSLIKEKLPTCLLPKYFEILIYNHAISLMSPFVQNGGRFIQALAMTSVQSHGLVPSASLAPTRLMPTLAAGLPHFTEGAMRVWGRDVFLSLHGLFLTTGQTETAKRHLVAFAGVLYHGLIPNLLDSQRQPRYNSRDTVWYFMQALQDYYHFCGPSILDEPVLCQFPNNEHVNWNERDRQERTIAAIMQEIMEKHAYGIHFREHLGGRMIDAQMTDQGFNIDIDVDWQTGILVGGNKWNCGTWMDKMGESVRAGNKGHPATPRDGAPIEITGLLKSALRWINQLIEKGEYQWKSVTLANEETKTFRQWEELLQNHFERIYYVPKDSSMDQDYEIISDIVHRRGIYKDVIRSSEPFTEYQLRPNFFIAMTVAPELFKKAHAHQAIMISKEVLVTPIGIRSLDFADLQYRPFYRNSDETDDFQTSKGLNYHQGPEWLWPMGYFLRSACYFGAIDHEEVSKILGAQRKCLFENDWCGLPELTNKNGDFCAESCPNQTWSSATLLGFLFSEKDSLQ
ncbi:glycoside hydrolase family 133 protein [Backusella circina FSU 941]|nr:glycoside hydrolase family 133 protein [Backusella circina FSU 941]